MSLDSSPGLRIGVVVNLMGLGNIILLGASGGLPIGLELISLFWGVYLTDLDADERMSIAQKESKTS